MGTRFLSAVIDKNLSTPPDSPAIGDCYLVAPSTFGAWAGRSEQVAEYNGTGWDFTSPNEDSAVWVENEDVFYVWAGGWAITGPIAVLTNDTAVVHDVTLPAEASVEIKDSATLNVSSGKTLTVNGPLQAAEYKVFVGSGSVVARKVSLRWFGATGNGTADDSTAFDDAVDAVSGTAGGEIVVSPGTYKITFAETFTPASTTPITITGAGEELSVIDGTGTATGHDCLLKIAGKATFSDLTIKNYKKEAILINGAIDRLRVFRVNFDNVAIDGSYDDDSTRYAAIGNRKLLSADIDDVQVSHCTFSNSYGGINLHATAVRNLDVSRNTFRSLSGWAVRAGRDYTYDVEDRARFLIHDNLVDEVKNSSEDEIHAFFLFAEYVSVQGNTIKDIQGVRTGVKRHGSEGIYVKSRYSDISGNVLLNAGYSEAAILLKGGQRNESRIPGYATKVQGNTIIFDSSADRTVRMTGIQINADDALVSDNYIEGANFVGIRAPDTAPGVTIKDNMIVDMACAVASVSPIGIYSNGSDAVIEGNVIRRISHTGNYKPFGILTTVPVATTSSQMVIRNNIIDDLSYGSTGGGRAINILINSEKGKPDGVLKSVVITGNTMQDVDIGVHFDAEQTLDDCRLVDNDFFGVANEIMNHAKVTDLLVDRNRTDDNGGAASLHRFELVGAFDENDTSPDVRKRYPVWKTANTSSTTLTDFDNGFDGQRFLVVINDAKTTVDFTSSNLKGHGGADWSPTKGDFMICVYDGTYWYCIVDAA